MAAPPNPAEPATLAPKRKSARRFLIFSVVILILATLAIALCLRDSSYDNLTWLTPAQMAQAAQPGPLTQLKYRLQRMLGPLNRYLYRKPKVQLLVSGTFFTVNSGVAARLNLGAPNSTNVDGSQAWLLSPKDLSTFRQQLKSTPGVSIESSPRIQTADGIRSTMSIGNSFRIAGTNITVGFTVDVTAKVKSDSVKLLVAATDIGTNSPISNEPLSLKTNLCVACKVSIPDSGAILIDGGGEEKHYWLLLSPVLVDATGKPIKH